MINYKSGWPERATIWKISGLFLDLLSSRLTGGR